MKFMKKCVAILSVFVICFANIVPSALADNTYSYLYEGREYYFSNPYQVYGTIVLSGNTSSPRECTLLVVPSNTYIMGANSYMGYKYKDCVRNYADNSYIEAFELGKTGSTSLGYFLLDDEYVILINGFCVCTENNLDIVKASANVVKKGYTSEKVAVTQVYVPSTVTVETYYKDVKSNNPYAEGIVYVTERGLMSGTGEKLFSPDSKLSRAQIVTMLYRMAGNPKTGDGEQFQDVLQDAWYAKAVAWASAEGVVNGTGNGYFSPETKITREQLAAMLAKYTKARNIELPTAKKCVVGFKDSWNVSSYAEEGVRLVWRVGIMNGDSQHNFGPKVEVSRAEAADVFMRLHRAMAGESLTVYVPDPVPNHDALSTQEKNRQALAIAQQIAAFVPSEGSDIERVSLAANIVSYYCSFDSYTMEGKDYRTPYGVFIKGEYSCAGATRALGMVLECMGYSWQHVNENQYSHQWCELMMDGQIGYADGQTGRVGYGTYQR